MIIDKHQFAALDLRIVESSAITLEELNLSRVTIRLIQFTSIPIAMGIGRRRG